MDGMTTNLNTKTGATMIIEKILSRFKRDKIVIGRADTTMIPAIVEVERAAFDPSVNDGMIANWVLMQSMMVAKVKDETVGYAVSVGHQTNWSLQIVRMAVHPSHQRSGLGTRMVTKLAESAVLLGMSSIQAITSGSPGEAQFFADIGFDCSPINVESCDCGKEHYLMTRQLPVRSK